MTTTLTKKNNMVSNFENLTKELIWFLMMLENQQTECFGFQWWLDDLERKKETNKGNQGEPAKDPLTVKSIFSLRLQNSEWNGSICQVPLTSWEMCGLSGENGANFEKFTPCLRIVDCGLIVCGQWRKLKILLSVC